MANLLDEFGLRGAGLGVSTNGNLLDEFGIERTEPKAQGDGAFTRGWNKAKQNLAITSDLALGDTEGAARTVGEASRYAQANPGMQEGTELMQAWEAGEGISGGIAEVGREFARDWDDAPNIKEGVKATGRNLRAMGEGIAEQTANMIAPVTGMITGGVAGSKGGAAIGAIGGPKGAVAGGAIGGLAGAWGGASIGNAAIEGGGITQEAIYEAGIDPNDFESVRAYLDENRGTLLKQASVKGGIIGAVDTATAGIAGRLLNGPARAASSRILASLGVDTTDKAAVKAAKESPAFAQMLAQDAAYQASRQGAEKIARNVAAAAIDPAGEFAGEYLGSGIALGDWDAKNAALEAFSSIGQSGVMFAGQKAYQAATGLGSKQSPLIQPQPSAENPAPAPVPAPDPNAGAISRTAALLPAPSIAGLLPAPDPVLYADGQGNVTDQGPARDVDREYRPTGREQGARDFGPGIDQIVPQGDQAPLEGQLIRGSSGAQPQPGMREPAIYDNDPGRGLPAPGRVIPDMRADNITVAPDGAAVPGKTATPTPTSYVQGGPGMDQQREVGKTYKGLPAANRAIRNAANPEQLEAVKVGPQTFEVRAKQKSARRIVNRDRDSVMQAVIRLGGVKTEWRRDTTGDDKGNKFLPGVGALWSDKTGTGLDDMASLLDQSGYVPAGEMERDGGVSWLQNALRDEVGGMKTHAAPGSKLQQEQTLKAEADRLEAQAAQEEASGDFDAAETVVSDLLDDDDLLEIRAAAAIKHAAELDAIFGDSPNETVASPQSADRPAEEAQRPEAGESGSAGAGQRPQGSQPDARPESQAEEAPSLELASQTEAELAAIDAANKARIKAEEKAQAEADEKRRKADDQAQIKAQSEAQADNFTLGANAEDSLSGQGGMFDSQPSLTELGGKPANQTAVKDEKPAVESAKADDAPASQGSKKPEARQAITQADELPDSSIIEDGKGKQYRVHYQRGNLVQAHPIVDGKAEVNSESGVRFHVGDPASADGRRTDPIYLVQARSNSGSLAEGGSKKGTSIPESADEYAARLRSLADEFDGTYYGRSLSPVARAMADHAIENGRRMTDAELEGLARQHDVPLDVIEQLAGGIFTYDAVLGASQRGEAGATALLRRARGNAIGSAEAGAPAVEPWHTPLPTEGLELTRAQQEESPDAYRGVTSIIAADAFGAITPTQSISGQAMDLYYLPESGGRNGVARFIPEGQPVPDTWRKVEGGPLNTFGMTREQAVRKITDLLSNAAVVGSPAKAVKAKAAGKPKKQKEKASAAIEDAGEKLGGARKDELRSVRERLDDMDDAAIAGSSLSQLWPKGELDKISEPFEAALYHVVRGLIPAKPRVPYRVKGWVAKVKAGREILTKLGAIGADASAEKMRAFSPDLGIVADQIEVLMALDRKHWGRVDSVRRASGRYNQDGEMVPGSWVNMNVDGRQVSFYGHDTVASAIPAIKEQVEGKSAPEKRMKFAVYSDRQTGDVFVVKDGDAEMRRLKTFKTVKEARAFLNDEYEAAVALWDAVKNRDNVTKSDMRRAANDPRVGQNHRDGKDVTPEQFLESFGFRGVEFGNWVKQGAGGRERQGMLNDAYDAFMDLAGILNIPPKALSLEGKLGIGFGSRGSGKASAHYEPDLVVINMTKTKGAGTLAHEWFHALDNYFARRRAEQPGSNIAMKDRETAYITYRPERMWVNKKYPSMQMPRAELTRYQGNHPDAPLYQESNWEPDANHPNGVRPQVEKAFAELVATLNASPMLQRAKVIDGKTSDGYWSRIIERGARSFETYVIARLADQGFRNDYLANVQTLEQFSRDPGRYPYLTPDEQGPVNEAFDKLFATLETKETDLGVALFSRAGSPIDPDGLSESSVVTGKAPENPISLEQAISAAEQFLADYNGNIELSYRIRKKQDELYGPGSIAKIGVIKGAYHPGRGLFTLTSDHLSSAADAHETLRHEILGHYGLDTFSPQDKQALLDKILASKEDPSLKLIWDDIAVLYKDKSQNVQAEEVFARLAESTRSGKEKLADLLFSLLTRLLRKVFGYKKGIITRRELLREVEVISKGIRSGSRQRQTFDSETNLRRGEQTETPAFKRWFGASKVVDKQGEPKILYHGTGEDFTVFDQGRSGSSTRHSTAPLGIFLTGDRDTAQAYADKASDGMPGYARVMQLYAAIRNPYMMTVAESLAIESPGEAVTLRAKLEREGYDGINLEGTDTWVAFSNTQVKSATDNNGEFDEWSGDIRFRRSARDLFDRATGPAPLDRNDPFAAENRRLREDDKTLWAKAKKVFARQFAPGGLLPEAVFNEKITRDSEFQAVEFDVRHLSSTLGKAVKADYGVDIESLTPAQMKTLAEALSGRVDPSIPESTKVAIVAMRQYIDSLSGEYLSILQNQVEANMEGADQALIDKITGNLGAYVNRSYQAFDDPKWFKTVPTEVVNAARTYLANGYMAQGETAAEAARLADVTVNEMLKNGTAYDSMGAFIAEGKLGAKDLTVLIKRKEIAPEIRALLGEYMDPRLNFAKSATKMGRLVWNQRFLDRVLSFGMGTILFEGKNRPADATTQIAGEKSETYAPLNGLWTFPEVAQAFQDALGKEQMSDLYRTVVRLNGMVKYGKTILSPTTAMRNWQSAMFFSLANGHFDLTQMKKSWAALREQVTQTATGDDLTYLRKLKKLGVVYDTPYAGEMMALLADARMDELLSSKSGTGLKWLRKANQFAQGFYSFGDDFWKIIGFENEKAGLLKAGIPLAEAEVMAAKRIRDTYPTYSMIGKAVQWLRRFPLAGTFVSFPSEIIRTTVNMMQLTAADLKSDNPGIRAIGRKRAAGIAMVSGGFYALAALTAAAAGVGDDEEEALRDLAAPWSKNSTFLYTGRDADGKLRYFDMSFLDPYGYWKRPLTAMLRDQPWEKAAASGIGDMLSPFLGTDIAAGAIFEVLANKKGSGGQVYQESAGAVDQTTAIADHLRKALQPGFVSNAERLLLAGQGARREGSGQPYDMRDEVVSLLGWRASTLDTQTALYYRSFEFTDGLRDASKVLNRTLRSSNKVTNGDIRSARETAQTQYDQAFKEMGRLVNSARAAGMSNQQIMQTLRSSGVTGRNAAALIAGRVPPMNAATLQGQVKAVQQARMMQGSEHAQEIARRFALARQL